MNKYEIVYDKNNSVIVRSSMDYDEIKSEINKSKWKAAIMIDLITIYPKNVKEIIKL